MHVENDMSGIVFFNDSENPAAPQLSGQLNIGGVQYRIAMWENEGAKGTFYGVSLQEVDAEDATPRRSGGGRGAAPARSASRSSSRSGGQASRSVGRSGKPRR